MMRTAAARSGSFSDEPLMRSCTKKSSESNEDAKSVCTLLGLLAVVLLIVYLAFFYEEDSTHTDDEMTVEVTERVTKKEFMEGKKEDVADKKDDPPAEKTVTQNKTDLEGDEETNPRVLFDLNNDQRVAREPIEHHETAGNNSASTELPRSSTDSSSTNAADTLDNKDKRSFAKETPVQKSKWSFPGRWEVKLAFWTLLTLGWVACIVVGFYGLRGEIQLPTEGMDMGLTNTFIIWWTVIGASTLLTLFSAYRARKVYRSL